MEANYVNLIMLALNLILFICLVACGKYMMDLISNLKYNDKRAIDAKNQANRQEEEARRKYNEYQEKLQLLNKAESIAALINAKESQ